jgi:CubicO group peptidase (beta-lactamase class C family)
LLTPETLRRLHTPPDSLSDYAYGWGRPERPWGGPKGDRFVITHSGSNTMWFCVLWIAPAKDFAVLVCCNTGIEAAGKACDEACAMMIGQELKGK